MFQEWIDRLSETQLSWYERLGAKYWTEIRGAKTEEAFKAALDKRIEVERQKNAYIRSLREWQLKTFRELGGTKWEGYINAKSLQDFKCLLEKHDEARTLSPEAKKLFESLGGFNWEGFREATSGLDFFRRLSFVIKEKEWPQWIERLDPKQRQMFEQFGGTDWVGFKNAPWEESFILRLEDEIKEVESADWIERLSQTDRTWFERMGGKLWAGYEECESAEELVEAIHEVIEETESVMASIAEDYPLACEQHTKLLDYGLSEPQLEYALKAIEAQEIQEQKEGKDLLFVFEYKDAFDYENPSAKTFVFYVTTRGDFVNTYDITESTYTDFLEANGYLDYVYETDSVEDICEYAKERLAEGEMSQEDYDDFRSELTRVLSELESANS